MSSNCLEMLNVLQLCLDTSFCSVAHVLQRNCKPHSVLGTDFLRLVHSYYMYSERQLGSQDNSYLPIPSYSIMQSSVCTIKSTI